MWTTVLFLIRMPFQLLIAEDKRMALERLYLEQRENGVSFEQLWAGGRNHVRPEYAMDWTRDCDRFVVGFFGLMELFSSRPSLRVNDAAPFFDTETLLNPKGRADVGEWAATGLPQRYTDLLQSASASLGDTRERVASPIKKRY